METNPLIGKIITGVWLAEDRQAIKFDLENGESIIAKVDADCCSSSWIEEIDSPERLIGTPIIEAHGIGEHNVGKNFRGGDYDYWEDSLNKPFNGRETTETQIGNHPGEYVDQIAYYGFKLQTLKGDCVIDYRNDSNGFYSGNLAWPDESFYGGVYGQNESKQKWIKVA